MSFINTNFSNNFVETAGGAIKITKKIPYQEKLNFFNNSAQKYGNNIASDAARVIRIQNNSYFSLNILVIYIHY